MRDPFAVRQALAGEILIMKGARHESGRGAAHRSPPIEDARKNRVVFVASTLEDLPLPAAVVAS